MVMSLKIFDSGSLIFYWSSVFVVAPQSLWPSSPPGFLTDPALQLSSPWDSTPKRRSAPQCSAHENIGYVIKVIKFQIMKPVQQHAGPGRSKSQIK